MPHSTELYRYQPEQQDPYKQTVQILIKDIEDDLNKWRNFHGFR